MSEDIPQDELVGLNPVFNSPTQITQARRLVDRNLRVANILNRLDIDGDGLPDNAEDTDGDGLPDNWEVGGFEALPVSGEETDRVTFFPSPSPIVPGTPPTPIFSRLAVATSALDPDTDGDGISDFVEVFGLLFVDENLNGLLDANEWNDKNGDGLPSPGEWPLDNSAAEQNLLHDFDGFVFTDPTNDDTDGDGRNDAVDNDPLINPRAFGNADQFIVKFNVEGDEDADNDGIGNGMDLGNDLVEGDGGVVTQTFQNLDNPENISELIDLFRPDLLADGVMPESQIEDLLGADWDSNGLWRTTDVREWSIVIDPDDPATLPPDEFFMVDGQALYATQTFEDLAAIYNDPGYDLYGDTGRGVGLGWHSLLTPSGRSEFLPDPHVWAILYAWRMPGFDIDGDGFIGVPNISSTVAKSDDAAIASVALQNGRLVDTVEVASTAARDLPFDDRIDVAESTTTTAAQEQAQVIDDEPALNGRIKAPEGFPTVSCGAIGLMPVLATLLSLALLRSRR
ncbi:MAG: hypothetical protein ACYSUI_02160 [Planctomycetota bacterium]